MNLASLWRNSYLGWVNPVAGWKDGMKFDEWWAKAKESFANARALSVYRYTLPAFQDLYGVDFETITDEQARALNDRIFANYHDQRWLCHVVTERANIELMFNDPHWGPLEFTTCYPFEVFVFRVNSLVRGFHPSEFHNPKDNPYRIAASEGMSVKTLDDYLALLERLFVKAKAAGAVCLKNTLACQRALDFQNMPKERAEKVFGRKREELSAAEVKDSEDFILWRLVASRHLRDSATASKPGSGSGDIGNGGSERAHGRAPASGGFSRTTLDSADSAGDARRRMYSAPVCGTKTAWAIFGQWANEVLNAAVIRSGFGLMERSVGRSQADRSADRSYKPPHRLVARGRRSPNPKAAGGDPRPRDCDRASQPPASRSSRARCNACRARVTRCSRPEAPG